MPPSPAVLAEACFLFVSLIYLFPRRLTYSFIHSRSPIFFFPFSRERQPVARRHESALPGVVSGVFRRFQTCARLNNLQSNWLMTGSDHVETKRPGWLLIRDSSLSLLLAPAAWIVSVMACCVCVCVSMCNVRLWEGKGACLTGLAWCTEHGEDRSPPKTIGGAWVWLPVVSSRGVFFVRAFSFLFYKRRLTWNSKTLKSLYYIYLC